MSARIENNAEPRRDQHPLTDEYYRELRRRHVLRLLLTYILPIALLALYFAYQYHSIAEESRRLHLRAIAENQANTLDLFLSERRVNLENLIDDPKFNLPPSSEAMASFLRKLRMNSETFVDLGYFDPSGVQAAYAGPFPSLESRNYSSEEWYRQLRDQPQRFVITDIYLGFRQKPHFTIAVSREIDSQFVVLRATLDPRKIYEYITRLEGASDVTISIVNKDGYYQVVTPQIGTPLESSSIIPPPEPHLGWNEVTTLRGSWTYAYSWLQGTDWALIVQPSPPDAGVLSSGFWITFLAISAAVSLLILIIIFNRASKLAEMQKESDRTRAQLEHAAKLASVGELAAGIAHEINNPLAVINEEAGLMRDLMDPEFGRHATREDLVPHLENIRVAVFRCRDITRKLLGFVRKSDMDIKEHDVHQLIDGVVEGLLGPEMAVSNIRVVKDYGEHLPALLTDGNQLQQVLLNIINNGVDALGGQPGSIIIATWHDDGAVKIALRDTGRGMTRQQLDNIFMPFFTTKEVGKGTGLGLSVSYGIIKSLGGKIEVESEPGKGSTFTISLPVR